MQWNPIIQSLKNQRCLLFIGPKLLVNDTTQGNKEISQAIKAHLQSVYPNLFYYEQDELFLFEEEDERGEAYLELKTFLDTQTFDAEVFQKVMEIPFSTIINFSPYLNPPKRFAEMQIPFAFDYEFYHKTPNVNTETPAQSADCWVYDLFGNIEAAESVVLTHNDLFNYVGAILGGKPLPTYFKTRLQEAQYFIFLGFSFEKWYVQLLIRLLKDIHKGGGKKVVSIWRAVKEQVLKSAESKQDSNDIFYQKGLKVQFIPEIEGAKTFINELYAECKKNDMLRKVADKEEVSSKLSSKVNDFIKNDDLETAISLMSDFFQDKDDEISDELILQANRFNRLNNRYNKGVVEEKEFNLERNKIVLGLQELLKELKNYE